MIFVDVQVKPHDLLSAMKMTFHEIFIPFTLATLGGTAEAPTWTVR